MMSPAAFPRRVLFTVTGLTPQIVTETIYALAVQTTPAFVPSQLVVMTTSDGANRVRLTLQGSDPGWLARLSRAESSGRENFSPAVLRNRSRAACTSGWFVVCGGS